MTPDCYDHCCGWPSNSVTVAKFSPEYGSTIADPRFEDPAGGDFSLRAGSPCRNRGANAAWMESALDLAGNPRISGDAVDIGCYERPKTYGLALFVK